MENIGDDRENLNDFLEEAELEQYYELFRDILKVTKVSQLKFVVTEDLVHIGLSKPEQRRYKKIFSKHFPNPYISKIKKLLSSNKKHDLYAHGTSTLPLDTQPFCESNVKVPTKHIISIEDITINKELGMGQFGVVQQGTWCTGSQRLQVAIKCLGHERMTSNSTEFLKEAAVMHSIEHPNIVRLYGVVLHMDSLMLVTELAPLRSLLECLREVSLRPNFPVPNLCEFAEQICDGMTYLEIKRLIHRDLAARNILVFSKDRVKISDFGLSRALGVGKDYYQTNYNVNLKLPVAWCAPECILYLRFTSASDVWAFGVCLWEMFTYGFQPWAAFSGQQILEAIDAPNFQRLERPECCSEAYYSIMLECWVHDPNARPKFKDLGPRLKEIRPEQVQVISNFPKQEDGRRSNLLEYKTGQIITVLGKENMTNSSMWYGVLPGGACGLFDPNHMRPYFRPAKSGPPVSPHPSRSRSIRSSLLRSDVKRHTYTGKRTIQRSMISSPQGNVKHTGHVGLDGAYFGDISFLDPAGCPPRQIVAPYKPSEDLEQQPLINPNSPSHLSGTCTSPYPLLTPSDTKNDCDKIDLSYGDSKTRSLKKSSNKSALEPTTSKSFLNKVKSATLGRSHKTEDAMSKADEVHEYHEISDTDTESNATDNVRAENLVLPESPGIPKSYGDFSQSLLDEMESLFKSFDGKQRDEMDAPSRQQIDSARRSHTLNKMEKKKNFHTNTMKPMSAHDQKTLDTACALANEITTKSMNDLDGDNKLPVTPTDKSKFHFKFPHLSLHHNTQHETDKENTGKQERRNFSKEANSVPDIQSTITEESKLAYSSLIEQPTPSSSRISHMSKDTKGIHKPSLMGKPTTTAKPVTTAKPITTAIPITTPKPATMPKPVPRNFETTHCNTLQKSSFLNVRQLNDELDNQKPSTSKNVLPLPPRNTKLKLVDKPRHIRKYPLKLPMPLPELEDNAIYQNAMLPGHINVNLPSEDDNRNLPVNVCVDVCDGVATNPFDADNPFDTYLEDTLDYNDDNDDEEDDKKEVEGNLVKDCTDHVSVEDLLEFADHKPCGRQRGVESDEVRIMNKVLKRQTTPEECLQALELSGWDVHLAIKVIRVKLAAEAEVALERCSTELAIVNGDLTKALALVLNKNDNA